MDPSRAVDYRAAYNLIVFAVDLQIGIRFQCVLWNWMSGACVTNAVAPERMSKHEASVAFRPVVSN